MVQKSKSNSENQAVPKKRSEAACKKSTATKRSRESKSIDLEDEKTVNTSKKRRKTTKDDDKSTMILAERTNVMFLKKAIFIGAHVSGAGGVQNSINNALQIGSNSFALFLRSQRKWSSPPLEIQSCKEFKSFCLENKYDAGKHILPHGSYLVNLAQAEPEKAEQAYTCFLDDLHRCEALGIRLYNFHPGSSGKNPRPEAIKRVATQLNRAHKATKTVVTVLENMAGAGNVIGSTWEDISDIIELIDDKSRVGVCIDTCHAFAAGYDIRSPEMFQKTMNSFSEIVGSSYLKAVHLNDSKAPLASNRDLHANIGTGFLGLRAFHNVVNYDQFQDLPMILETPIDRKGSDGKVFEDKGIWASEIKLLEGLIGTDPETDEFKAEEKRLQDLGLEDRKKFQIQNDKKKQKSLVLKTKTTTKKKIRINEAQSTENSEDCCNH